MIFTIPIPLFLLIVFWRLRAAEPTGLPFIRPSCLETAYGVVMLSKISVLYGIGTYAYIAGLLAP